MASEFPDDWFRPGEEGQGQGLSRRPNRDQEGAGADDEGPPRREGAAGVWPDDPETSGRIRVTTGAGEGPSVTIGHVEQRIEHLRARPQHRFPVWMLWMGIALAVGVVIGTVVNSAVGGPEVADPTAPTSGPRSDSSGQMPWQGAVRPVDKISATASCTADPAPALDGGMVSYEASQMLDGDNSTAWRCDGAGAGQRITLTVPANTRIVGVGLVNGYAKSVGKTDLYPQYRRVLKVRWSLPDGSWFVQDLTDDSQQMQTLMVPPNTVDGPIVMTIIETSEPGQPGEPTRDAVLISNLRLLTKA